MQSHRNIYYFRRICEIGGIETFFRELSKKYKDWDITFVYQEANPSQLKQIQKYCRCIKFDPKEWAMTGRNLECEEAFFNFNLEFLDFVKAKRKTLVVHGNYKWLNGVPPLDKRINRVVAVSNDSAKAYTDLTGIPCEVCYNPIEYIEYEKPLVLICACRLEDRIKGGQRTRQLLMKMDKYCLEHKKKYICLLFSREHIEMPNVINMKPTMDIRPYMMMADYLLQLSDNVEGYNYSVNEMLYLCNKPVVITPCNVYDELGIDDTMSIRLNFDMSNVDEVIDQMFNKKFNFKYKPPMDRWNELLAKGESTYQKELKMKYKVKALSWDKALNDKEVGRPREVGEVFEVSYERLMVLQGCGALKIEVVEKVEDATAKEVKKATRRTKKNV